jgi:hypothetical protein
MGRTPRENLKAQLKTALLHTEKAQLAIASAITILLDSPHPEIAGALEVGRQSIEMGEDVVRNTNKSI